MKDIKRFDSARREMGPVHLDLVENYAKGRLSRKDFIRRGTVIGLSIPTMSMIIAACGGSDSSTGSSASSAASSAATSAAESGATSAAGETSAAAPATTGGSIRVGTQKPAGPLDPVAMQDLGSYGTIVQSFEFLAALQPDGNIGPGLAESWEPNADGTVWTFKLRPGVKWQNGADFTSADVAATMDRLVEAGNAGLKGVIDKGSVDTTDPAVAKFTLISGNGNFPYLVSVFNAQAVITPADYASGTTLDQKPDGTGPWKLVNFDPATGASYARNEAWWGGMTPLDTIEFVFFDDLGTQVSALQGGALDALVQFQVIGGEALLNDPNFNVIGVRAAAHRQIWMRCDTGQFKDKRVRQALMWTLDRQAIIDTLFKGKADIGNDTVFAPSQPWFDASIPQRTQDIEKAKQLLADAGFASGLKSVLNVGTLQEIPDLAVLIQSSAKQAGFDLQINNESLDTFYGSQWCPAEPATPPCSGAAELGVVDYGHRATPDVYLNAALKTEGIWNSSQYASPDFDAAFTEYQKSVTLDAQKAAASKLQTLLNEDVPVGVPYFYNYLAGFSNAFTGVYASALGQMFFEKTAKV